MNQTGQPYAYVGDDPVDATDPLGLLGIPGTGININVSPSHLLHAAEGAGGSIDDFVGRSLGSDWNAAKGVAETDWSDLTDLSTSVDAYAEAHPLAAEAVIAVTVCVSTVIGCDVVGYVALAGNEAINVHEYLGGQISGDQFAADTLVNLATLGVANFLPEAAYAGGRPDLAAYLRIGTVFNTRFRALVTLGGSAFSAVLATAADARASVGQKCPSG